jgi:hypothetical protein
MPCGTVSKEDFDIVVIDGSATPIEITADLISAIRYSRADAPMVWLTDGDGKPVTGVAPLRGERGPSWIEVDGRVTAMPSRGGNINATSHVTTHGSGLTYQTVLRIVDVGKIEPRYVTLNWLAGGSATATDDALKAEYLSKTGITATGTSGTGPIVATWPTGTVIEVVSDTGGTGTSTVGIVESGTTAAAGATWRDLVLKAGVFAQLVSTVGNDGCIAEHKTYHVEIRPKSGTGPKFRLINAAHVVPEFGMETAAGKSYSGLRFEAADSQILETAS